MKFTDLKGKRILIAGYGKEGKSTERYIRTHIPDTDITIVDKTDGPDYLKNQGRYDVVIKSPGIRKQEMTVPYQTATNLFFDNTSGLKIGVTGTKGKSTTTKLIYDIIKRAGKKVHLVGNIGNPWLDEIPEDESENDIYVCELSSYQLDDIEYSPHISVFVSFFPEHMDYHGSIEAYWDAKSRIVRHASSADFFVYNPKFPRLRDLVSRTGAQAVSYAKGLPFPLGDIPLSGEHNADNVRAAVAVAAILKIDNKTVRDAVRSFQPLPHRLQNIGTFRSVTFYDDAISTTPESTMCAIAAIPNISVLLLGGQDRGYDFSALVRYIYEKNIRTLILFPDSGSKIEQLLSSYPPQTFTVFVTSDMKTAVQFAYGHASRDSVCLLSTASPSYSVWKNFEEKGDLFQKYVKELGASYHE